MRNIIPLWLKKEKFLFAAGLSLVLSVNLYLRSFPINFPQLKDQAKEIVRQIVQQQAMNEVHKKFPQYYYSAKDAIVKSEIKQYYRFNRENIRKQTGDFYANMKNRYQDDSGQTYLMELDCWHWARYVENVLKYGHPGDEVIAGRQWDMFMLAPAGAFINWEQFLFYLSAVLYKIFSFFKQVPLFTFCFYLPLFFVSGFLIILYLFSYRYGGHIAGLTSGFIVGLAPIFLPRSCAGWFDTDVLNMILPVLIIWSYLMPLRIAGRKWKIFWLCVCALLVGLFSFTWSRWWFILLVILIYEFLTCGWAIGRSFYHFLIRPKVSKPAEGEDLNKERLGQLRLRALSAGAFLFLSLAFVRIIAGADPLVALFNQVRQALILNKPLMSSVWPNVYSTVGELRKVDMLEVNRLAGEGWIIILSLVCMAALLIRSFMDREFSAFKRASIIIFAAWFLSMAFASLRGVRFVVFLLVPLAVSLGWVMNEIYFYFRKKDNKWAMAFVICVSLVICLIPVKKGYAAAKGIYPLMDDTWYKVLNLVKEKTPQDTIINSWWDFGDWFKVVARRRVIFDGQSQDIPQAYWMAKAMLSANEEESTAILRMLNNAGNKAFEIMNGHIKNELQAVLLLEYALTLPQDKAEEVLKKFLPDSAAQTVSKIIFSRPASALFVVDHTMPLKMPAISYLGNWNFAKVYIAQNLNKLEKNQIVEYLKSVKGNDQRIQTFYQEAFLITANNLDEWLSARMQFYSALLNGTEKNGQVYFDNGFIYNISDSSLQSNSGQIVRSVFVFKNDNLIETLNPQANVNFSALIYETKGAYKLILLERELANSLFVRLYFLEGRGLRHFGPFVESEEGNNYIRYFAITW